jgi:hypothetical protein
VASGELFTFGFNESGQLGQGHLKAGFQPQASGKYLKFEIASKVMHATT